MLKYTLIAGSAAILGACAETSATGPAIATGAGAGALVGGPVGAAIGGAVGAVGAGAAHAQKGVQATPAQRDADRRRFYDARSGRYYYQDPATGRYFYENGDPYP